MSSSSEVDKDQIFEILSSSRRRQLLYHLHRRGGAADLRDLARDVATAEVEEPIDEDVVKRLYISLYQTHVPKLEEAGLIHYHQEERRVELTGDVGAIGRVLGTESNDNKRWPLVYALLGLAAIVTVVTIEMGVLLISPIVVALVLAGALLLLTVLHYYLSTRRKAEHTLPESIIDG